MMERNTINLYECLPKEYKNRMSWTSCVKFFSAIVIILFVFWTCINVMNQFSKWELDNVVIEKRQKRQSINDLRRKYPKIAKSVKLQAKLNEVNETLGLHNDLREQISNSKFSNDQGFSKYLEGLSRNVIDNLWLTEIKIQKGGTYIVLKGLTDNVANVQKLIKKLEGDEAFDNKSIKLKKIETSTSSSGNDDFSLELIEKIVTSDTKNITSIDDNDSK